jgi:hypothetical protein
VHANLEPCSRPPYFYLSKGEIEENDGFLGKNVLYLLPLHTGYTGNHVAIDSGPLSVKVHGGQRITASYVAALDLKETCWDQTTFDAPDYITVQYVNTEKAVR